MARDYYSKIDNDRWIPHSQYMQALWFIRSYYELSERHDDIIEEMKSVSDMDGMPHGTNTSDETADKAARVERIKDDMDIIDNALQLMPDAYQLPIWKNIHFKEPWPTDIMDPRNWSRWKNRYIRIVAKEKGIIE